MVGQQSWFAWASSLFVVLGCSLRLSGADAEVVLKHLEEFYSIRSLQCEMKEQYFKIADLSNPNATRRAGTVATSKVSWDSSQRFSFRSNRDTLGNHYILQQVFDGKTFLDVSIDPETGISFESSLKPNSSIAVRTFESGARSISLVTGLHRREFLDSNKDPTPLIPFMRRFGKIRSVGESTIECVLDRYVIRIEMSALEPTVPSRIEYRLIKTPPASEVSVVNKVTAELRGYQRFDSRLFPTELTVLQTFGETIQANGNKLSERGTETQVTFSKVRINQEILDSDLRFELDIPNYTPVRMIEANQLKYYWLDGQIVPATDEEAVRIAKSVGLKKLKSKGNMGIAIWIVGVVLVCIGVAIAAQRFRNRS